MTNSSQLLPLNFSHSSLFGTFDQQGTYDIVITARNPSGGNVSTDLMITVATPKSEPTWQIVLISALMASGVCLLGLLGTVMSCRYLRNKKLRENKAPLNADLYDENAVVRGRTSSFLGEDKEDHEQLSNAIVTPIAEAIAKSVKILGMNRSNTDVKRDFKEVVRNLLTEISHQGVDTHIDRMGRSQREALIREIVLQTKRHLTDQSTLGVSATRFFQGGVSLEAIKQKISAIAFGVAEAYGAHYREGARVSDSGAERQNLRSQ
jgi:ribosomal protein L30/L7E